MKFSPAKRFASSDLTPKEFWPSVLWTWAFIRGAIVKVLRNAPLVDPVEFVLEGSHVSLRHEEAHLLEVALL